ncbi:hypothetical protein HN670_03190 [bacterium]|nr:hypothetical protein [bacterium]
MKKFFTTIFSIAVILLPQISFAETSAQSTEPFKGFLDFLPVECMKYGDCGPNDVAVGFVLLTKLLIGAVGALALLYFIWGGIQWLTSYGNLEKIRRGREIMINTIVAIVVVFLSFLLVEFFVNDVLLGGNNSKWQVASECQTASKGSSCGPLEGRNYVCTGSGFTGVEAVYNNLCVSKCELRNIEDETSTWLCFDKDFLEAAPETVDECAEKDELCVNATTFDPAMPILPSEDEDDVLAEDTLFGCCVSGIRECHSEWSESDCLPGDAWFTSSCDDVNMCQFGYHYDPGCCLGVRDDEAVRCQYQAEMTVCEWPLGITPGFHANTACPPDPLCL